MMEYSRNTPQLRFKGFEGEIEFSKLKMICSKIMVGIASSATHAYSPVGIPMIRNQNIKEAGLDESDLLFINSEYEKAHKNKRLKRGDILTVRTGYPGLSCLVPDHHEGSQCFTSLIIRPRSDEIYSAWLVQYINSPKGRKRLFSFEAGGAQKNINAGSLEELPVPRISLPEQQKIASFLSAIDERIQQLTRKKELLEQYKKGVMQQLFSGKLRFKDENGKVYPKWEEKLYEDVFTFYSTNSLSRDNLNYEAGTVKNIHYGDIHTKYSSRFDIRKEHVPYINAKVELSRVKQETYCQEGDLIIADASEDYADIGKTIELINLNNELIVAGLHTFLARPNKAKMHKGFSGYLVQAPYIRTQVMTIAQGTKVLSLSPGRLGKIKLRIPVIPEQEKIATYLSCIDNKIENVITQITQTKMFKKGLLQQMFV